MRVACKALRRCFGGDVVVWPALACSGACQRHYGGLADCTQAEVRWLSHRGVVDSISLFFAPPSTGRLCSNCFLAARPVEVLAKVWMATSEGAASSLEASSLALTVL